ALVQRYLESVIRSVETMKKPVDAGIALNGPAVVNGVAILREAEVRIIDGRVLVVLPFQMGGLRAHVGQPEPGVLYQLPFDREIPLLRVRGHPFAIDHDGFQRRGKGSVRAETGEWEAIGRLPAQVRILELPIEKQHAVAERRDIVGVVRYP